MGQQRELPQPDQGQPTEHRVEGTGTGPATPALVRRETSRLARSVRPRWGMSWWRMLCIGVLALSFLGASLHQVVKRRDDWPLSAYTLYPSIEARVARRSTLVGVASSGEFSFRSAHIGPMRGQIKYVFSKNRKRPKRLQRALQAVQREYEARRQRGVHAGPPLQGLRMYVEAWTVQQGLQGIETPDRRLTSAVYFPPLELAARWALEASEAGAPALPATQVSAEDVVLMAADGERSGASDLEHDVHAARNAAVVLSGPKVSVFDASLPSSSIAFEFEAAQGRYAVWARVKSAGGEKQDSWWVVVDGQRLSKGKSGSGNFRAVVPKNAYVWVSHTLEEGPVTVALEAGRHRLVLALREGPLVVDQVWLSRTQLETPAFNSAVTQ